MSQFGKACVGKRFGTYLPYLGWTEFNCTEFDNLRGLTMVEVADPEHIRVISPKAVSNMVYREIVD